MSLSAAQPPAEAVDERAVFKYLDWQDKYQYEKPFQVFSAVSVEQLEGGASTNLVFKDGPEEIVHDARPNIGEFSLDKHGFAFCKHSWASPLESTAVVESEYLPQMETIIREELNGVDQVCFFDWRIRRNVELDGQSVIDANDKMQHLLPARHVHLDQAPAAVIGRTRLHLPDQADFLLRGRVRIINLWRPLIDVVEDRPLAFCDTQTIGDDDLVEADHVRKQYSGTNYYAKHSNKYKWYYLNRQRRDEVLLLKIFDSRPGALPGSLHSSFDHTEIPSTAKPRESIEVRALVFTYAVL